MDMEPAQFEPLQTLTFGNNHAWRMNVPARLVHDKVPDGADACVSSWIIQAPWAHPTWNSYWLLIMHLRPLIRDGEQFKPPLIYLEGATHELQLHALDPAVQAEAMAREVSPRRLTPSNFCAQLKLESDEAAAELAATTARDVLEARLNPDTDFIRGWAERFGDNMLKGR